MEKEAIWHVQKLIQLRATSSEKAEKPEEHL